jgi:hypothetical protein
MGNEFKIVANKRQSKVYFENPRCRFQDNIEMGPI